MVLLSVVSWVSMASLNQVSEVFTTFTFSFCTVFFCVACLESFLPYFQCQNKPFIVITRYIPSTCRRYHWYVSLRTDRNCLKFTVKLQLIIPLERPQLKHDIFISFCFNWVYLMLVSLYNVWSYNKKKKSTRKSIYGT